MKKLLTAVFAATFVLLIPAAALAVDVIGPACDGQNNINNSAVCADNKPGATTNPLTGPDGILTKVIFILSMIVAIVATIVIIIAAIRFLTSQGNPQTVTTARNQIIYAIVGLIVAGIAQAIVQFVIKRI